MKLLYLDQSDFSYFAVPPTTEPSLTLKGKLLQLRDASQLAVAYSYAHLAEILPTKPEHKQHSLERAIQLKAVCGQKVFDHPANVWKAEAERAVQGEKLSGDIILFNDGRWLPGFDISGMFQSKRSAPKSRQQRRRLAREADALINKNWKDIEHYIPGDGNNIKQYLRSWILGNLPGDILEERITEEFYDPERVVTAAGSGQNPFGNMREQIDRLGSAMTVSYAQLTEICAEYVSRLEGLQSKNPPFEAGSNNSEQYARVIIRRIISTNVLTARAKLLSSLLHVDEIPDDTVKSIIDLCPGFGVTMDYKDYRMMEICEAMAMKKPRKRSNNPDKFRSDGGDGLHLTYLPYVDYFRCDKDTYNFVKTARPDLLSKCYPTQRALLDALNRDFK